MAKRSEHLFWGGIAGAGICLATAALNQKKLSLPELIGAILSGTLAATFPDRLEPAIHPNHRAFFHSVAFAGVGLPPLWAMAQQTRARHLRAASFCEWQAAHAQSQHDIASWQEQVEFHKFFAGVLLGLIPGYASHLAADAATPKSLPLI